MQLLCLRLSELAGDERLTAGMASLAKMNHAAKARAIVADARDILGGNGILLEHHVATRSHEERQRDAAVLSVMLVEPYSTRRRWRNGLPPRSSRTTPSTMPSPS